LDLPRQPFRRNRLFVSPSIKDAMQHSAYKSNNGRTMQLGHNLRNPKMTEELTAVYYALVEEG